MRPPLDGKPLPEDEKQRGNILVDDGLGILPAAQDEVPPLIAGGRIENPGGDVEQRLRRLSRRGFTLGGVTILAGFAGWRWLVTRGAEDGLPWPFRRVLEFNEGLSRRVLGTSHLSPEFSRFEARMSRVNGSIGLDPNLDLNKWRLQVVGSALGGKPRWFTLDDIKGLPRVEMTTELRCIEGWSTVVHWAGARLSDLAAVTGLATRGGPDPLSRGNAAGLLDYAALETPDSNYFVGLDMASALHAQTLLCYEMNDQPLTPEHGAPLRLVIPVKYGIKNLKQIGTIRFTDVRPADYWAERGYDWYAGH
jgi:DMSO/TMAO reductase YedYZ molybdopterin-dependent catalytic subunit